MVTDSTVTTTISAIQQFHHYNRDSLTKFSWLQQCRYHKNVFLTTEYLSQRYFNYNSNFSTTVSPPQQYIHNRISGNRISCNSIAPTIVLSYNGISPTIESLLQTVSLLQTTRLLWQYFFYNSIIPTTVSL